MTYSDASHPFQIEEWEDVLDLWEDVDIFYNDTFPYPLVHRNKAGDLYV